MAVQQATADPEEVRRILRLVESDPQIRSEVRRVILTQELLDLPQTLAAFIEATDRRLEAVDSELRELRKTLKAFMEATDRRFELVDIDLKDLKRDMGDVKGDLYERRVREQAAAILSRVAGGLRRLHVLPTGELANQLVEAVDAHRISEVERDEVLRADAVARAVSRVSGQPVHVVIEASVTLGQEETRRALIRRDLVARAYDTEAFAVVVSARAPDIAPAEAVEVVRFSYGP
jgi:hypothetical protein